MNQDQNKPDQDVENASSEGSSTDTSAQSSNVDTQSTSEQQTNADDAFFSYSEQAQKTENTEPNPKKSAFIKVVSLIVLILLLGLIAFGFGKATNQNKLSCKVGLKQKPFMSVPKCQVALKKSMCMRGIKLKKVRS